jgi:hypothetical protein
MIIGNDISSFLDYLISKLLPTIISAFVLVSLFLIGHYINSRIRSKDRKQNWYLNVLVLPNIDKVNIFFNEVLELARNSIENLVSLKDKQIHNVYLNTKSSEFGKIQKLKRDFEFEFILLISTGLENSTNLINCLNSLEDNVLNILDKSELEDKDSIELESVVKTGKTQFYTILFNQIR